MESLSSALVFPLPRWVFGFTLISDKSLVLGKLVEGFFFLQIYKHKAFSSPEYCIMLAQRQKSITTTAWPACLASVVHHDDRYGTAKVGAQTLCMEVPIYL